VVPDLGARTDAFTRSVLTVDARHRAYSQCWVETNGATVRAATALLTATFAVTNADVQVAPLVVDGAPEHHQPPSISFAWIACGALLGFANALFCFLRRLDSALFGLLGMTFRQRAVAIGTELMLADAFAAGAALLAVIGWLAGHGAFPRPALAASGEFFVASVALAGALTLVSVALVGTRQWFSVLREG
jgi:hypothetical protein